ncbi:MAG: hypothetical protein RJA70_1322 [Pseudomonadota bacterium]|jgi:subtilisin family serine protease
MSINITPNQGQLVRRVAHNSRAILNQLSLLFIGFIVWACGAVPSEQGQPAPVQMQKSELQVGGGNPSQGKANPAPGKKASRAVWVVMKQKANLTTAKQAKGWKARGNAVHSALRNQATQSQVAIRADLDARGLRYKAHWIVNAIKVTADDATIASLKKRSDVERVFDDYTLSIPKPIPSALKVGPLEANWNITQIGAQRVWDELGIRGEGIVVANIDTGVEFQHPALANQYRGLQADGSIDHSYSWFDPSGGCTGAPCDNNGHGTHTMGSMVGDDGNGNQIGVAPGARWIAAKGCEDGGCSLESLVASGEWMLAPTDSSGNNPRPDLRPQVVNNSWGGGGGSDFYRAIVQAWESAGIFPVFSNGNSGPSCGSVGSPGDYPESYGVGAFDQFDNIADFSSRGTSFFGVTKPNVSAPGVDVFSSVPGGFAAFSGTSMAGPHVAGAIALIWSAAPAIVGDVAATRAILDQSAEDRDDTSCGGEPGNNNVWGEGRLNAFQAIMISPTGPSGFLVGTVSSTGTPIQGAAISIAGNPRGASSDATGAYTLRLPVGSYEASAQAFGYLASAPVGVQVDENQTVTQDFNLAVAPSHLVEGAVTDPQGSPIANARVSLVGTPLPVQLTDAAGRFSFGDVPEGTYSLSVSAGGCFADNSREVIVSAAQDLEITLGATVDAYGYQCSNVEFNPRTTDTVLPLFGDDNQVQVALPFGFWLYGTQYSSLMVTTNGYVAADSPFPSLSNGALPDPSVPNAAIYALWDDLVVDFDGTVATGTHGTAPNREFVIEWGNARFLSDFGQTVTFQMVLRENGQILIQYMSGEGALATGSSATIGIENAAGDDALQYSNNRSSVTPGSAVLYQAPPAGLVSGSIADRNDSLALAGASVTATEVSSGVTRSATTAADGTYALRLAEGNYDVVVSKKNYQSAQFAANVVADATISQSFSLATALGSIAPSSIQLVVGAGQVRTRTLTLSNTGSAALNYEVGESGGAKASVVSTVKLQRNPAADRNAKTTKDLYVKQQPRGIKPQDTGDVLATIDLSAIGVPWGTGFNDSLWFSDASALSNSEYGVDGVPTGLNHSASWAEGFPADMAYDSSRGLMCQLAVGGTNSIHCWDPATGNVVSEIGGAFPWTAISQRGLAYNASDDTFFVGGWNEGIIYRVAGSSAGQPGAVLGTCMPADGSISGLAYNASQDVLWVSTNSPDSTIYQLNAQDCTVISVLPHPSGVQFDGAGLEMDEQGNLWTVSQNLRLGYLIESGVPSFSDVSWLTVTPAAGSVAVGASAALNVTIDTTGLAPGLYLAKLAINTDAGRKPRLVVPVSVVVSAYLQAVNAGGNAYVDGTGDTWVKDKSHSNGSWGYVQKGKTRSVTKAIAGTTDPILYRSQRENAYAYRYDGVPNGIYEIDMRFAEITNTKLGKRMFDVVVEKTMVLPAHDIVYEVGTYAANNERFFVEVTDGRLDVRFIARAGAGQPVINALRVVHRTDR